MARPTQSWLGIFSVLLYRTCIAHSLHLVLAWGGGSSNAKRSRRLMSPRTSPLQQNLYHRALRNSQQCRLVKSRTPPASKLELRVQNIMWRSHGSKIGL
ncbi:hypothetical protein PF010_g8538 [Phytophthora fragariae]|uniref:RxLR effector protein n=1 Tax=Phytophthora fragariae TaxID=53985 RepID=A0A6G0LE65_9STRA|nr:hypothetical protein PF010_g8538 [Phytophthora fragariae]